MSYEHDFLISYAHIDDQTLIEGEPGWVSVLHRLLEIRVGQLAGQVPRIWRDPKLQGNDYFADTILERLPRIAALVSVVSPRYVQSEWCNRELKEFCRAAEKSGGVRVADKARVFKVVKTPVQLERLPEEMKPILGYEFFSYDSQSGRPRELVPRDGAGVDRTFLAKLDDLAYDIVQLLELLSGTAPANAAEAKGTVFLAETSFDLRQEREAIKRDLIRNGYAVLPDQTLPLVASDLDTVVSEQLERSALSVHLIGKNYGLIPEGGIESMPERQQVLASARGAAGGFTSLIWVSPGVEADDERQRKFIDRLQTDPAVHAAAEVLRIPLEVLKTQIYRKLAPPPAPAKPAPAPQPDGELTRIYLLCDQEDVDATAPLADHLFAQGYEVILPIFDEDEAQTRIEQEENLKTADALIVYYGTASELWLRRKLRDVEKAAGLGREKLWLARAIYVAAPPTAQKERFRTLEATVLREPAGGFDGSVLEAFTGAIANAKGAR